MATSQGWQMLVVFARLWSVMETPRAWTDGVLLLSQKHKRSVARRPMRCSMSGADATWHICCLVAPIRRAQKYDLSTHWHHYPAGLSHYWGQPTFRRFSGSHAISRRAASSCRFTMDKSTAEARRRQPHCHNLATCAHHVLSAHRNTSQQHSRRTFAIFVVMGRSPTFALVFVPV